MKLLTKVHLLYCSCYVKQQYGDDNDNESSSLCVNTSCSKIAPIVNGCLEPPGEGIAVERAEILFLGGATGSQPVLLPCHTCGTGELGLLLAFRQSLTVKAEPARLPPLCKRET